MSWLAETVSWEGLVRSVDLGSCNRSPSHGWWRLDGIEGVSGGGQGAGLLQMVPLFLVFGEGEGGRGIGVRAGGWVRARLWTGGREGERKKNRKGRRELKEGEREREGDTGRKGGKEKGRERVGGMKDWRDVGQDG